MARMEVPEKLKRLLQVLAAQAGDDLPEMVVDQLSIVLVALGGLSLPGHEATAPQDKQVRQLCAELLGNLLARAPKPLPLQPGFETLHHHVLRRLCRDKVPLVRLAALGGVAELEPHAALPILTEVAASDSAPKARLVALVQLQALQDLPEGSLEVLASRSLDKSPVVRCRFFAALTTLGPSVLSRALPSVLLRGLGDTESEVRGKCECMVRAWLDNAFEAFSEANQEESTSYHGRLSALLSFLRCLLEGSAERHGSADGIEAEAAADLILVRLLSRLEWHSVAARIAREMLAAETDLPLEEAFLGRAVLAFGKTAPWAPAEQEAPKLQQNLLLLRRTLQALDAQRESELRHMLGVLLQTESGQETSSESVIHVAMAVLTRAPPPPQLPLTSYRLPRAVGASSWIGMNLFQMAVLLIRRMMGLCGVQGPVDVRKELEANFARAMAAILKVIWAGTRCAEESERNSELRISISPRRDAAAAKVAVDLADLDLPSLADRFKELDTEAGGLAHGLAELQSGTEPLTEIEASKLQSQIDVMGHTKEEVLGELWQRLSRLLAAAEAALLFSSMVGEEEEEENELDLFLKDALRRALVLTDMMDQWESSCSWRTLRTDAVRCIALFGSQSERKASTYWDFFLKVLERYLPLVVSPAMDKDKLLLESTEALVGHTVSFLTDALLTYAVNEGLAGPWRARSKHLLEQLSPMLTIGPPQPGCGPTPPLRRLLGSRLLSLLLLGGLSEGGLSTQGAVSWVMSWLLLETFLQTPPPFQRERQEPHVLREQEEAAAHQSCVLRFLSMLSKLSLWHAGKLAFAAESFLSLDLWSLCRPLPVGKSQKWCCLPLTRVVRFLSHHLAVAAAASPAEEATEVAGRWLEQLWRPLALICIETAALAAIERELPQALLAALEVTKAQSSASITGEGPVGGIGTVITELDFVPDHAKAAFVTEVAWVLNRVVEFWSPWTSHATACPTRRHGAAALTPLLLSHRERFVLAAGAAQVPQRDWSAVYQQAEERRTSIRRAVAKLGVDVRPGVAHIAAAAAGAIATWEQDPMRVHRAGRPVASPQGSCAVKRSDANGGRRPMQKKRFGRAVEDDDSDNERKVKARPEGTASQAEPSTPLAVRGPALWGGGAVDAMTWTPSTQDYVAALRQSLGCHT